MNTTDGIPKGYVLETVRNGKRFYRGPSSIVVTGRPPDEGHLPEEERHNCDAMGCGWEHVLTIMPIRPELGTTAK
jgi:hypothetical protein